MSRKPIEITFEYDEKIYRAIFSPGNPVTTCDIYFSYFGLKKLNYLSSGIGVCKHGDTYNKRTGFKMALKSALRKLKNQELRPLFWEKFLEIFPPEKEQNSEKATEAVLKSMLPVLERALYRQLDRLSLGNSQHGIWHITS